jgi:hypothetical protein
VATVPCRTADGLDSIGTHLSVSGLPIGYCNHNNGRSRHSFKREGHREVCHRVADPTTKLNVSKKGEHRQPLSGSTVTCPNRNLLSLECTHVTNTACEQQLTFN